MNDSFVLIDVYVFVFIRVHLIFRYLNVHRIRVVIKNGRSNENISTPTVVVLMRDPHSHMHECFPSIFKLLVWSGRDRAFVCYRTKYGALFGK
jgi:hypothetical protein